MLMMGLWELLCSYDKCLLKNGVQLGSIGEAP